MENLIIRKCKKCGAMIQVIKDCSCDDCGIKCCNETMSTIKLQEIE